MKLKIKIDSIWTLVKTSWFTNDGSDGVHPFITAEDVTPLPDNIVIDADYATDKERLKDTRGENTGNETPSTIGALIETTELETITDTTKIAGSVAGMVNWFSGLRIKEYLSSFFQSVLVSGTNIKTINSNSLVGSGNIAIKTIVSIVRTSGTGAPGTTDTYTITYSDGTTSTFTVANGNNGTGATVTQTVGTSTGNVPCENAVRENLETKLLNISGESISLSDLGVIWSKGKHINTDGSLGTDNGNQSYSSNAVAVPTNMLILRNLSSSAYYGSLCLAFYSDLAGTTFISGLGSGTAVTLSTTNIISFPSNALSFRIMYHTATSSIVPTATTLINTPSVQTSIDTLAADIKDILTVYDINLSYLTGNVYNADGTTFSWGGTNYHTELIACHKSYLYIKGAFFTSNVSGTPALVLYYEADGVTVVGYVAGNKTGVLYNTFLEIPTTAFFYRIFNMSYVPTAVYSSDSNIITEDLQTQITSNASNFKLDKELVIDFTTFGYINETGLQGDSSSAVISPSYPSKEGYAYRIENLYNLVPGYCIAFYTSSGILIGGVKANGSGTITQVATCIAPANTDYVKYSYFYKKQDGSTVVTKYFSTDSTQRVDKIETRVTTNEADILELQNNIVIDSNKPVIMVGDSIANQIGNYLASSSPNVDRIYENKCVGGESVLDSLARSGCVPYIVLPFTIPALASETVDVTVYSSISLNTTINATTGAKTYSNKYNDNWSGAYGLGINPWDNHKCTINGISGTIYFIRYNPDRTHQYFKRDTDGDITVIDRPTICINTNAVNRNSVIVAFMGTNGGWFPNATAGRLTNADTLVNYYKKIADWIKPVSNDFLFLGFYMTAYVDQSEGADRIAFWEYFETQMEKEFGIRYLSARKYLREFGWSDCSVTLTANDLNDINIGKIPLTAATGSEDGVHLTQRAAACVANQVLGRLKEIGSISDYNKIDVSIYDN